MKNLKRILILPIITFVLFCGIVLSACGNKTNNEEPELLLDGVNVVLSIDELDDLLLQASVQQVEQTSSLKQVSPIKAMAKEEYTKAKLLIAINQIKENIENSTRIGISTVYDYEGTICNEKGVVTEDEAYFYSKQGKYETESWYKNEQGTLYYYEISNEEGYTCRKMLADPFLNNNGVYDFCQGKFTFTCKTLTEDDIESFKVNKNKMYIKLNSTIFNGEEYEVSENFVVKNGRIVTDHLQWEGVDLIVNYTYDNDVSLKSLSLPKDIEWEQQS